jgi:hypothetical protein
MNPIEKLKAYVTLIAIVPDEYIYELVGKFRITYALAALDGSSRPFEYPTIEAVWIALRYNFTKESLRTTAREIIMMETYEALEGAE